MCFNLIRFRFACLCERCFCLQYITMGYMLKKFHLFYRYCGTYKITESSYKCTNTTQDHHAWANVLKAGDEVCVECQPFAMHKHFGMRCKGHGVPGKVTRWRAIDVPHCNGRWELKTVERSCTCNVHKNKDFIFI